MMTTYQPHYLEALNPGSGDLRSNLLGELRDYLGLQLDDQALYMKCRGATVDILDEWRRRKIDPKDTKAVTAFYIDTKLYCYELIAIEIDVSEGRQEQLKSFADLLKKESKLQGCDYGSGIGTLGIYLNRNGIRCDFADVSDTNLGFIRKRLERRGLSKDIETINLTRQKLTPEAYDFVTAFDVLEHSSDPVALIQEITSKLRPGGLFIFNMLYDNDPDTPHVLMDPNPIRKNIRGFGMTMVGTVGEFKIYRKVSRPAALNHLIRGLDAAFWSLRQVVRGGRK
jgi:2-polyprenyl-3-methyl-5-hydroxy-6-metoxy-1,4-benzoquinol methylase